MVRRGLANQPELRNRRAQIPGKRARSAAFTPLHAPMTRAIHSPQSTRAPKRRKRRAPSGANARSVEFDFGIRVQSKFAVPHSMNRLSGRRSAPHGLSHEVSRRDGGAPSMALPRQKISLPLSAPSAPLREKKLPAKKTPDPIHHRTTPPLTPAPWRVCASGRALSRTADAPTAAQCRGPTTTTPCRRSRDRPHGSTRRCPPRAAP